MSEKLRMWGKTLMKKRLLAVVITASIISSQTVVALAEPATQQQIEESKTQLNSIEQKIAGLEEKIQMLDQEIIATQDTINKNNADIDALNKQIEDTKKQIEKLQEEVKQKKDMFDKRMRAIYKSGGQNNYLSILVESKGFSDFIARIEAVSKLMGMDKKIIEDLQSKEKELNDTKKSLDDKNTQLLDLKKQNETKMAELQSKKKDQDAIVQSARAERAKIVVDLDAKEMSIVQFPIDVINKSSSSDNEITNSINTLVRLRSNIVSTNVDKKIESAINKGKETLRNRADEARRAAANTSNNNNNSNSNSNSSGSGSSSKPVNPAPPSRGEGQGSASASNLINYAYNFLGIPYVWGGTTPSGFDCSGFTSYVYRAFGYNIGRTTYDQINVGTPVSRDQLKPGDLVFPHAGHVGIYIGNGQIIHSPQTGDVLKISPIWQFYAARRVL